MHWGVEFIGKKPEQVDFCWGLLRAVYDKFGISLPPVEGLTLENAMEVANQVRDQIAKDWTEVEEPFDGCAVGMSQKVGELHHVGVYTTADGGRVIHCWGKQCVIAEPIKGLLKKGFKTIKFYRHKSIPWHTS